MAMEYDLSDIRAATANDGMFGGNGGIWALLLLFLFAGNGFGFGGRNQAATTDEVAAGFNFQGINSKLNELTAGQAGINQNLSNAICTSTYELASKIDACCCQTGNLIGQVRYDMAVQNGDLKALIHSEAEATRSMIQQDKIENLQQQVSQLQLQSALCGIPRTSPYGYGIYAYPACGTGVTYGCNTCTSI